MADIGDEKGGRWNATDHGDEWWIHMERKPHAPAVFIIDTEEVFDAMGDGEDADEGEAEQEAARIAQVVVDALNEADRNSA